MKDKLFVDENYAGYIIRWFIADDQTFGATLGDFLGDALPQGDDEHFVVTRAVAAFGPERNHEGYYWHSRESARKALRAANAALKSAKSAKPWPEWAKQAAAAGWKAPKGWEP